MSGVSEPRSETGERSFRNQKRCHGAALEGGKKKQWKKNNTKHLKVLELFFGKVNQILQKTKAMCSLFQM